MNHHYGNRLLSVWAGIPRAPAKKVQGHSETLLRGCGLKAALGPGHGHAHPAQECRDIIYLRDPGDPGDIIYLSNSHR